MKTLKFVLRAILFCFLTLLTQIGGLIYVLSLLAHKPIHSRFKNGLHPSALKLAVFSILYLVATFFIVPIVASPFGRVPLPLTTTDNLKPLNFFTCVFNRHYVRPELKQSTIDIAKQINKKHPGTTVNYLDASFPFINGFPLFPHLSHSDGKKLDLAFCYIDNKTGKVTNETPSFIGYGINEEPRPSELNTTNLCTAKGRWQYSFLTKIIPQGNKSNFVFDSTRTKDLATLFALEKEIGKIFIEPHLKIRLNLTSKKFRFHGCQAVRHDDHIHVQMH